VLEALLVACLAGGVEVGAPARRDEACRRVVGDVAAALILWSN